MRDHHQEPEDVSVVQIQGGLSLIQHALWDGESTSDVLCRWCNSRSPRTSASSRSEVGHRPKRRDRQDARWWGWRIRRRSSIAPMRVSHLLTQVEVQTVACQSDHLYKNCRHPHNVYSKFGKNWLQKRILRERGRFHVGREMSDSQS